jgi:hypothetical protein
MALHPFYFPLSYLSFIKRFEKGKPKYSLVSIPMDPNAEKIPIQEFINKKHNEGLNGRMD